MELEQYAVHLISDGAAGQPNSDANVRALALFVSSDGSLGQVSLLTYSGGVARYDHLQMSNADGVWGSWCLYGGTYVGLPEKIRPEAEAQVWMSGGGATSDGAFGSAAENVTAVGALDRDSGAFLESTVVSSEGYWTLCWDNHFGERLQPRLQLVLETGEHNELDWWLPHQR